MVWHLQYRYSPVGGGFGVFSPLHTRFRRAAQLKTLEATEGRGGEGGDVSVLWLEGRLSACDTDEVV